MPGGKASHLALVRSGGTHPFALQRVPTPRLGGDEVSLATLLTGVCGTDLDIGRRARPDAARILGHEGIAEVVAVGERVVGVRPGDRYVINPVNPDNQDDIIGHSVDGLFQTRFALSGHDLAHGRAIAVGQDFPLECGPLVEPLATAVYGMSLVRRVVAPASLIVIGAGPAGLLNAVHARLAGVPRVIVVCRSRSRAALVAERGILPADQVLPAPSGLDTPDLAEMARGVGGQGADAVFVCVPRAAAAAALASSLAWVRPGGCVDLVSGFPADVVIKQLPSVDVRLIRRANVCGLPEPGFLRQCRAADGKPVWLTGHRGTSASHLKSAIEHLRSGADAYQKVVSHVAPLAAAPAILSDLIGPAPGRALGGVHTKVLFNMRLDK